MAKISKATEAKIRNVIIATWQRRVTVIAALETIVGLFEDMMDEEQNSDIREALEFTANRKFNIDRAAEEIIELIED